MYYFANSIKKLSSDWLTAGNINQMQYVAFMMMVARHCGYKPGVFTHFIANQQIYDRHIDNASEMLKRYEDKKKEEFFQGYSKNPILYLKQEKKDFYSFTIDDFVLEDYEPIKPQLTFELGI